MLKKEVTYEVSYGGAPVGEIKGSIYYDIRGYQEYEVRNNCLFNGDEKIGEISCDSEELIMTRISDGTLFTIEEKK